MGWFVVGFIFLCAFIFTAWLLWPDILRKKPVVWGNLVVGVAVPLIVGGIFAAWVYQLWHPENMNRAQVGSEVEDIITGSTPIHVLLGEEDCAERIFVFVSNEKYVVMQEQEDGGLIQKTYFARDTVIYEDTDGNSQPRVEEHSIYKTPILDEGKFLFPPFWRELTTIKGPRYLSRVEYKIYIPEGSIAEIYTPIS